MSTSAAGKGRAFDLRNGGRGALVLIGGTTASGKSALALCLAERTGGVVINADSQQLFADLRVLTARPSAEDEMRAEHRLYGVLAADQQPSVGRWLALVEPALQGALHGGRPAILVGGTGLYIEALLRGIALIPSVPEELRRRLRGWAVDRPTVEIHRHLAAADPDAAARLRPSDRQRLLRALEVIEATGRPLGHWQRAERQRVALPRLRVGLALVPPAVIVRERAARRVEAMLAAGALYEVKALLQRRPDLRALPIAKVHGCRELLDLAAGRMAEATAAERIAIQVRQYAKRQRTFLRHRLPELPRLEIPGESLAPEEALGLMAQLG